MDNKQEQDGDEQAKAGILGLNQLSYRLQPDLSVCVSRSICQHYPQSTSALPQETSVFTLNSGSAFIDWHESYLSIDVKNTSVQTGTAWFGRFGGSACNLVDQITISSRSGQVIETISKANLLAAIRVQYERALGDTTFGAGSCAGIAELNDAGVSEVADPLGWTMNSVIRFCIPLTMISPLFAGSKSLWPASLCSGLRVEILWARPAAAMCSTKADAGQTMNYSIANISINAQSYLLSDLVLRNLNSISASAGLEVVSSTYFSAIGQRNVSMYSTELAKAASRALMCIYSEKLSGPRPITESPMAAAALSSTSYCAEFQFRLGSLYFPSRSVRGNSARETAPQIMSHSLMAFNSYRPGRGCTMSEKEFRNGGCVFAQSLERSNCLELAGQPLSNSRVLQLQANFVDALVPPQTSVSHDSSFYLKHVILIRVFSQNCTIEI